MSIKARGPRKQPTGRSCGPCRACCIALPVPEIGKPKCTKCEHCRIYSSIILLRDDGLGDKGCAIHESRPLACRKFRCMWLKGAFKPDARPDLVGGVFFVEDSEGCVAHETEQGAMSNGAYQMVDSFLAIGIGVTVVDTEGLAIFISPDTSDLASMFEAVSREADNPEVARAMDEFRRSKDESQVH